MKLEPEFSQRPKRDIAVRFKRLGCIFTLTDRSQSSPLLEKRPIMNAKHLSISCRNILAWLVGVLLLAGTTMQAQYTILHTFGDTNDGTSPWVALTLSGSTLYGTTYVGGSADGGTVFQINTNGTGYTILYNYASPVNGDVSPGSLTLFGATLYGMTSGGGSNNAGTVFQINTNGTGYTILHNFGSPGDGQNPQGSPTLSGAMLYGMAANGGSNDFIVGVIFQMNTNGTGYTILHNFGSPGDGYNPYGSLTLSGAMLYGMTSGGGSNDFGTVFQINTNGTGYTILHNFTYVDGDSPIGSLTLSGSTLYGTTGGNANGGTAFQINTNGTGYTILHNFGSPGDGNNPSDLTLFGAMLYGMTSGGGSNNVGTVFQINTNGTGYTILHNFSRYGDGWQPLGPLTLASATLYGMTGRGGSNDVGIIFSLSLSNQLPTAAVVTVIANPTNAGSVSGTASGSVTTNCGASVTVTATPTACYQFANWTEGGTVVSSATNYTFTVTGNRALTANFTLIPYTVTTGVTGSGTTSDSVTTNCGASVTVTATPTACYQFANWTEGGTVVSTATNYTFTVTGNRALTANFTLIPYTVTTGVTGSGTTSGDVTTNCGATVAVAATPGICSQFVNWTEGGAVVSTATNFIFTTAGYRSLTANFTVIPYTITTQASPPAGGTISGGGTVLCGSNVTISATTNAPYRFIRWTENGIPVSAATRYSFTAVTNRNMLAVFSQNPLIVSRPVITNAVLVLSNRTVVVAGETNVFQVGATDVDGNPLAYRWSFGDGINSGWLATNTVAHAYTTNDCGPYTASVTISNGYLAVSSNLAVVAACDFLAITKLQVGLNLAKTNSDSITLTAKIVLPGITNVIQLTSVPVVVDVGDAQMPFTLDKGRGVGANGTCVLAYTKPTKKLAGFWTATITLSKGNWRNQWLKYRLDNATHKNPGVTVTLPVVVLIDDEAFAAEPQLHYTATKNKTGTAK